MNEEYAELRAQVFSLIAAAVTFAVRSGRELSELRGIAHYDPRKDAYVAALEPFDRFEASLRQLPILRERFGEAQARRITLQVVYEYFARVEALTLDETALTSLWDSFLEELQSPVWITRCVTNLRFFGCDVTTVDLGEKVWIYGRDPSVLARLGFADGITQRILAEWGGFGSSSFVLVTESSESKRPENLIEVDSGNGLLQCARAIGAMRLVERGDVGISAIYVQRIARFNVGVGGVHWHGGTAETLGSPYVWRQELLESYRTIYSALARLERSGYKKAPGNLDLALRAFMSTYDRFPTASDTKLVDAITALEALLGAGSEIAFKLSFRVASLLASTNAERGALLKTIKNFYDARSRIVHGGRLGKRHSAYLEAVDDLRELVRRVLRSFVRFAADDARQVAKGFFEEDLDAALVDADRREEVRTLLGLA